MVGSPANATTPDEIAKLDYEQTMETYRQLVDIRFKLLAFIPTLTAVAVSVLSSANIQPSGRAALSVAGFLATVGVLLYELRNTQFHDGAYGRLRHLEKQLGMRRFGTDTHYGLFGSRLDQTHRTFFSLPAKHDPGLWIVYSSALAAWTFAAFDAVDRSSGISVVAAVAVWLAVMARLATLRGGATSDGSRSGPRSLGTKAPSGQRKTPADGSGMV
jgi:hypothetical protein